MGDKAKILVIDDDPQLVEFLTLLLQDHGYDVVQAADGEQGLQQLRDSRPDLVREPAGGVHAPDRGGGISVPRLPVPPFEAGSGVEPGTGGDGPLALAAPQAGRALRLQ